MARILVVDDEHDLCGYLKKLLEGRGYEVDTAHHGEDALVRAGRRTPDLALLDLKMPKMDGMTLLKKLREAHPSTAAIIMTGYGTVETAVAAMKLGACDYINKPFDMDQILLTIEKALEKKRLEDENEVLRRELEKSYSFEDMISQNGRMRELFELVRKIAATKSSVLITGETGTGKELIARALHHLSDRRDRPFVPVDCGALTESLLESELFGHVRGAFTGAVSDKKGLLETAEGGTVFLDEIGHISLGIQAKLLRVLHDGEFKRVGDAASRRADVRLVSATNEDIRSAVAQKRFREDLYYRLNVVGVHLPPLRERKEDIPLLVEHFIWKYNLLEKKTVERMADDVLKVLMNYDWPGNVRELENVIHRAVVMESGPVMQMSDIPQGVRDPNSAELRTDLPRTVDYRRAREQVIENFEKRFLEEALRRNEGNVSRAAEEMGIDRRSIQRKLNQYRMKAAKYRP